MTTNDSDARAVLVLTSTGDEDSAQRLSRTLVEENLAACVMRHAVRSVYRWEDGGDRPPRDQPVRDDEEVLLVVKTSRARLDAVQRRILEVHPYACPEVVAVDADRVDARYLEWLLACVD